MLNALKVFWKSRDESRLFWLLCFIAFISGIAGVGFGIYLDNMHPSNNSGKMWAIISAIILVLGLCNMPGDVRDTGERP